MVWSPWLVAIVSPLGDMATAIVDRTERRGEMRGRRREIGREMKGR